MEWLRKTDDDCIDIGKTWGVEGDGHDIGRLTGRVGSKVLLKAWQSAKV